MKKRKGIWMALLTVVLSVAMLMGTMSLSAFADVQSTNVTTDGTSGGNATFVRQLKYGEKTDKLKGATKVIAPSGRPCTLADFTPYEIGVYTVYYGDDYSYTVPCVLDKDYEIRVADNGADIPTYLKTGGEFTVPEAAVWYKSENPKSDYDYEKADDFKVQWVLQGANVKDSDKGDADGKGKVKLDSAGTYTLHYYYTVGGVNGTKYLYKDYTVKVQNGFNDTVRPTLNIVNVPSEISLNTKITLPKATATDNYDSNVKVSISVTDPDGNAVKRVELDEDKYAATTRSEDVVFENDYNLSFYPTKLGKYKIVYTAVDDNPDNVTSATTHTYEATAVDRSAPVLKKIADEKIPTKWGLKVNKKADDGTEEVSSEITFPYPEYVDNNKADDASITVSFEIKDVVNSRTVIRFDNIYDQKDGGNEYNYNPSNVSKGIYQNEGVLKFTTEGLKFDFSKYTTELVEKVDKNASAFGTYTVSYQARDTVPNITTKTYDITLEDTFTDNSKPNVSELKFDEKYILFTKDKQELVLPTPIVSDESDSRPEVVYTLSNAAGEKMEVKGGETLKVELVGDDNVPTLTLENAFTGNKSLEFSHNEYLKCDVKAVDDAGNEEVAKTQKILILSAEATEFKNIPTLNTDELTGFELVQGKETPLGNIKFSVDSDIREFVGFEISFTADGKLWTTGDISLKTYYDKVAEELHIDEITVAPPAVDEEDGEFAMFIRIFNVAGLSHTTKVTYKVGKGSSTGGTAEAALNISNSGTVQTTYLLRNKTVEGLDNLDTGRKYIVRTIEGKGKFSLMSSLFTAYNAGSFTFTDSYYKQGETKLTPVNKVASYSVALTESATPAWQIQGPMPSYSEKSTADKEVTVNLPRVVASTSYANAKVELAVTDPDGTALKVGKEGELGKDVQLTDGIYSFKPTKDGNYTLTYTATYGDSNKITQTYTMSVGDVVPPTFTVDAHNTRATENSTFKFNPVTVSDETDMASIRYVKTLKAPDGSTVYSVDGKGNTYASKTTDDTNKAYTFTKSGDYIVEYVVYDKVGNSSVTSYKITVSAAKVNSPISTKIISTVLIIVAVLLLAGLILYFVRFRKVKNK